MQPSECIFLAFLSGGTTKKSLRFVAMLCIKQHP